METDVIVEHPTFGTGEITEVSYDMGDPLVSVQWDDGRRGCYWVEELEFLAVQRQEGDDTKTENLGECVEQTWKFGV
ncbi:MAG: hypothetical protein DRJ03_00015 [Chloroflexi bacterium]|nr:MAG: hypothetical protein DRJ03_00015 [Chloroflexota bacterium]